MDWLPYAALGLAYAWMVYRLWQAGRALRASREARPSGRVIPWPGPAARSRGAGHD